MPSRAPTLLPTRRSADAALLLGLLSLPFSLLAGVPAVVLGVRALRADDRAGGRGRAWTGVVLGSLTSVAGLVLLAGLGVQVVDVARDLSAPAGSDRAQQRDAERASVDGAALARAVGLPLDRFDGAPGVTLTHDPGATVDCVDSCSTAQLEVTGAAARSGPLDRAALLQRLRAEGYRDARGDGTGCPPLDLARPCRLRPPGGGGSVELVTGPGGDYLLRVDGG